MKIRVLIVVGTVLLFSMAAVLFSRYRAAKHVVYAKLAAQLVAEGEYSGAIDNAKRALELRPNYPEAYHAMGIAYGRLGRFDEAEESLRKAVSLAPSSPAARFNLALVLEKKGKYEDALALLAQAEQMKGEYAKVKSARATIYYSMGRKAIQAGRMGEAEKLFLRAVESKPDMPEAHYALGELYRRQGKYKDAVTRFNSVIQISPGAAVAARLGDVYQKLGEAYVRDGNHEKAIDAYRRASVLNPKNGPLRYCLGIALVRSGDYEAGRRALGEAFRIAPDLAPDTELARDCVDRARHCLDAGDLRGAAEQLDLACSIQPGIDVSGEKARLSMEYGDRDGSSGNFRGALDYYREAEKLRPELPQLVEKLARALAEGGELKEAIERYERLSAKNPTTVRYIAALGDLYFKSGNYQKAAEYFAALGGEGRQRLLESYERWASAENDPAKAAALYQKCLELKPENADSLRSRMYLALARSGHHDEAIRKMEALLKKYPAPAPPTIESLCMQSLDDVKLCRGEDQFRGDYLWNFTTSAYPIEILGTFEVRAGKQTYKKGTVLSRDRNQTVIIDFKGPYAVESTSALLLSHDGGKRTRVCLPP
jgi:tetratricopeptide (TPR) repeat protein